MAKHVLSLEAPETLNETILKIIDMSIYTDTMPIDCPILNITLPGFNSSVELGEEDITTGFNLNLTNW